MTNLDRNYMIFNYTELNTIDFNEVLETSSETVRKSSNGTKTFVKWDGNIVPTSVQNLTSKLGPYTDEEFMVILKGTDWENPSPYPIS